MYSDLRSVKGRGVHFEASDLRTTQTLIWSLGFELHRFVCVCARLSLCVCLCLYLCLSATLALQFSGSFKECLSKPVIYLSTLGSFSKTEQVL